MRSILILAAAAVALTAAFTIPAAPAAAKPRPARCVIDAAGAPRWSGPCQFEAGPGGSFTITPTRGRFQNQVSSISLAVHHAGMGEVRGLTAAGINSRWGEARRSPRDRACWIGPDFSLCVY